MVTSDVGGGDLSLSGAELGKVLALPPRARRGRADREPRVLARAPGYGDAYVWLSDRLLVQVRTFRAVTVITPSGVLGRYEWRRLRKMIRDLPAPRRCLLDLVHTLDVPDTLLITLLAAHRRRRYRGTPLLVWNQPQLLGCSRHVRRTAVRDWP